MPGVIGNANAIVVRQKIVPDDVSTKIRKSFERSAGIDAGRIAVEIENGKITLAVRAALGRSTTKPRALRTRCPA